MPAPDPAVAFDRAIQLAGGSYGAVARRFNLRTGFGVSKWRANGVPAERVIELCSFTDFQVTPHHLRPDIYPHPDDGLPVDLRRGVPAPDEILEQLREVMTEDELRELTLALDQGEDIALGYVRGLAEKHRIAWTDTVIAQGLAVMAKERRPS
jgi:DNA-binding transcriptional regulator YdaS (Cro superfamily)